MGVSGQRHCPAVLQPRGKDPSTHWTGGWVNPRVSLDAEAREKIVSPLPGIEPRSLGLPVRSQTLYWLSYFGSCGFKSANSKKLRLVFFLRKSIANTYRNSTVPNFVTCAIFGMFRGGRRLWCQMNLAFGGFKRNMWQHNADMNR
jgi:hypothetical protein